MLLMFPFHLHGTKTHTPGFCSSGVERVIRVVFDVETERLVGGGRFGGKKYMLYNVIVLRVNKKSSTNPLGCRWSRI